MQRTINVEGRKIKIVTKITTRQGNHCGYRTKIHCEGKVWEDYCNTLYIQEAMDKAYAKWVKNESHKKD